MTLRAAIYRRISKDREGEELGVARQEEDLLRHVEKMGWILVGDYVDNDISASTRTKKSRPAFQRMITDARAGKLDLVLAYTSSRLTRRPRELEDLIDLAEQHGTRFEYLRSPSFDLNTVDGRLVARMLANADAAEAERIGERGSRQRLQAAQAGKFGGGRRPFGFTADGMSLVPEEAQLIREAADELLKGGYLAAIVNRWNEAGYKPARGERWRRNSLVGILQSPRTAGLVKHQGGLLVDETGEPVKAGWPAILDYETWQAVNALFDARKGPGQRQPFRSFLLSGTLRCACGTLMYGSSTRHGTRQYKCAKDPGGCGAVSISGEPLDKLVEKLVERRLDTITTNLPQVNTWDREGELQDAQEQSAELMAAYRAKQLPGSVVFPQVAELEAHIAELKREKAAAERTQLPPSGAREMWNSRDLYQRRVVVKRLFVAIVVHPAPNGSRSGPRFDRKRVVPEPREV